MALFSFDILDSQNHPHHAGVLAPSMDQVRALLDPVPDIVVLTVIHEDTGILPSEAGLYHFTVEQPNGIPLVGYMGGQSRYNVYSTLRRLFLWNPKWVASSTLDEASLQMMKQAGIPADWKEKYDSDTPEVIGKTIEEASTLEVMGQRRKGEIHAEIEAMKSRGLQILNQHGSLIHPKASRDIQNILNTLERVQYAKGVSYIEQLMERLYRLLESEEIYLTSADEAKKLRAVTDLRAYIESVVGKRYSAMREMRRKVRDASLTDIASGNIFSDITHGVLRYLWLTCVWLGALGFGYLLGVTLWGAITQTSHWTYLLQTESLWILSGWGAILALFGWAASRWRHWGTRTVLSLVSIILLVSWLISVPVIVPFALY